MHIHIHYWLQHYGYTGVFLILMLEMIGVPFPAETTLTVAGAALSSGTFTFVPLFFAAILGNIAGSSAAYWIGRLLGHSVLIKYGRYLGITSERLDKAEKKLLKYRAPVLLFSKFIAGIRVFVPYLSGINKLSFKLFTLYNTIAAVIWALLFLFLGRWIHVAWRKFHMYLHGGMLITVAAVIVVALLVNLILHFRRNRVQS